MLNISKLSTRYRVRKLGEEDSSIILHLQNGNPLYFEYCPPEPSITGIINDLRALPDGKSHNDKYYIGFFDNDHLVAIMDLIVSFPEEDTAFIGLFMMDSKESGKGKGSSIIDEALIAIRQEGYKKVRLAYMRGNPQSEAFWGKCGFIDIGVEKENNRGSVVVLERILR